MGPNNRIKASDAIYLTNIEQKFYLGVDGSLDLAVVLLLRQPTFAVEHERLGHIRVKHLDAVEEPVGWEIRVVVANLHLEDGSKIYRLDQKLVCLQQQQQIIMMSFNNNNNINYNNMNNLVKLSNMVKLSDGGFDGVSTM